MGEKHFVTGATGFVGAALVLEILARDPEAEVYCLVRGENPDNRLGRILTEAAEGFGQGGLHYDLDRVWAVSGDIGVDECAVSSLPASVDAFWHSAASLSYEEELRDEIFDLNLHGTRRAMTLAARVNARDFNYVSTAYTAGSQAGHIMEDPHSFWYAQNVYEESKVQAEHHVSGRGHAMFDKVRILRPSVVVGHSQTAHAFNWSGYYGILHLLAVAKKVFRLPGGSTLRLCNTGDCAANYVPVDYVARNAYTIHQWGGRSDYYHLANLTPTTNSLTLNAGANLIGLNIEWSEDFETFNRAEQWVYDKSTFFRDYGWNSKSFDMTNTGRYCDPGTLKFGGDDPGAYAKLAEYFYRATGSL